MPISKSNYYPGVSADDLVFIVWKAVRLLSLSGLQVAIIVLICSED